jgi:uncharacterized membrane protein/protein-disulfide isomerase
LDIAMNIALAGARTEFSTPVRWALRVLAWLAFAVSSYLAWHAIHQTRVAGCGVGIQTGCDIVLSSSWSYWLGIKVAVLGLGCYATLATLSVFLDWPLPGARRWITTAFTMLALVAGVASLWFIGVQVFAIGDYCRFCIVADVCGLLICALTIWAMTQWRPAFVGGASLSQSTAGLMALRSALPAGSRTSTPISTVTTRSSAYSPPPSRLIAVSGAAILILLFIGGQVLFRTPTSEIQAVALQESIEMDASKAEKAEASPTADTSSTAQERTAMRIPAEPVAAETPSEPSTNSAPASNGSADAGSSASTVPESPRRQRLVKFFGGKLTLDVYKHPIIGSPEAPHIIVEMVSYDCPHCREMHNVMHEALKRYGDQVAILVMVIPLERSCNKLVVSAKASHPGACATARMALGVAALRPAAFPKFHDWLMADKEKPPESDRIVSKAYATVDGTRLSELSSSGQLTKQIEGYVNLLGSLQKQSKNNSFGLPVQILGDKVMTGKVEKADEVFKAWEEHLGVTPK